jgi:hypothetical protein
MRPLGTREVGVLEGLIVADHCVEPGPSFVAHLTRRAAPVLGWVLSDETAVPDGWFARMLLAHETSLLRRRLF